MTNSLATSFFQKTIFSGIQPSGVPHLGNYLGVFREWLRIQQFNHQHSSNTPIYFCIADLHALSSLTPPSPAELRENTLTLAKMLVALGIQPSSNVILFQQSAVPYHTQLQWLLTCRSPLGLLSRMSQWKAKTHVDRIVSEEPGLSSHLKAGLFVYPILQAADILLYRATDVPVGNDQLQHLEFSRDVAKFFNSTYKTNFFPFPKAVTASELVCSDHVFNGSSFENVQIMYQHEFTNLVNGFRHRDREEN
ncbi:Tryptophan--tRNA ligase, mitochondrial [Coelomomyces lativittatus]|nr:Tryptophan--tRNA ligase, mitochondrial [Coelomomyces lativittatus]